MKCFQCGQRIVYSKPNLCKTHFIEYFENKVKKTIKDFELIPKDQKLLVATSGGKDSVTCLYIMKKLGYNPEALIIDEGIRRYRADTLADLKTFCNSNKVKLTVVSFEAKFGYTLDKILEKFNFNPCTVCGVLRRFLLNKYSKH